MIIFKLNSTEYAEVLTEQSHITLAWLFNNDYITEEAYEYLVSSLVAVPIQNKKSFGKKLLERFFNENSSEEDFVFPLVTLEEWQEYEDGDDSSTDNTSQKDRSHLKIIK